MSRVTLRIDMPDWGRIARELQPEANNLIAATLQTQRAMIFDSEGRYNGRPGWAPLKFRSGQILKDTGTLSKSIGPQNSGMVPSKGVNSIVRLQGDTVTIGTSLGYAAMMNWGTTGLPGGVLRAKAPGGVLAIPLPGGKSATPAAKGIAKGSKGPGRALLFAKYVRIPARRFDEITSLDEQEIRETLAAFIADKINGSTP
jgi:phage gpG-like protein